ncbi:uncharacterized [Tachysurus ichikawai]
MEKSHDRSLQQQRRNVSHAFFLTQADRMKEEFSPKHASVKDQAMDLPGPDSSTQFVLRELSEVSGQRSHAACEAERVRQAIARKG